ncbi:MAG: hypothetical protein CM1200mP39_03150 [Dehalococcoidia bacterium]|nr:MAG: hypothetical protein CM1200mP39_03150 [Dehalococcoidia bacterium]
MIRGLFDEMDVPTRQSYMMALVRLKSVQLWLDLRILGVAWDGCLVPL